MLFNIENFIKEHITKRSTSIFDDDLVKNRAKLIEEIEGKSALVIGGAGTIGSSFVKQLLKYNPSKVIVVDSNENGLTELVRDVRSIPELVIPTEFITYPISYSDEVFYKLMGGHAKFDIIANFAAHKHVRSEKDIYCIEAMIKNNVINANRLLESLVNKKPNHFFCVSTDKAANPVNIMGASKKLMEDLIMSYSDKLPIKTARFANVAFSNGSLLAGFIERLGKSQPLSCPSDVKRYFVSPEESGQICLLACILGDSGDIFFPKLQEANLVSFSSIIPPFLKQFGYKMDQCKSEEEARLKSISIKKGLYPVFLFSSETDGEKLFEEFYTEEEIVQFDSYNSLGVIKKQATAINESLLVALNALNKLFEGNIEYTKAEIIEILNNAIPTFSHVSTGLGLDAKM